MFERTLDSSWHERSRFGVTTMTSFGLQAVAVGALLILPLLRPAGIPLLRQLSTPISLAQPLGESPYAAARARANTVTNNPLSIVLIQPPRIPNVISTAGDDAAPALPVTGSYIPGSTGAGGGSGEVANLFGGTRPVMAAAPAPVARTVRLSHMTEGDLVHKVVPAYPPLARSARIQGIVVLQAMISKLGAIENLRLLSGHPMLALAAIEAVSHWRYRPYILNDEPVEGGDRDHGEFLTRWELKAQFAPGCAARE